MEVLAPLSHDDIMGILKLQISLQSLGMTPWFSYMIQLPLRPLPPTEDRPAIKTERLIVRPILSSDVDGLYDLRRRPDLQKHSKIRGRIDKSKDETERYIEALKQEEENHWYFGAFLQSTGEMIGEGGLPDCVITATSASGYPEAEFFIKPEYQRQGYGAEFFKAVTESWWDLPRERRRHQLIGAVAPGLDAGDPWMEGIVFQWEEANEVARSFFAKMLAQAPASAEGGFESIDTREGREGQLVRWAGTLIPNPRPQEDPIPDSSSDARSTSEVHSVTGA